MGHALMISIISLARATMVTLVAIVKQVGFLQLNFLKGKFLLLV